MTRREQIETMKACLADAMTILTEQGIHITTQAQIQVATALYNKR